MLMGILMMLTVATIISFTEHQAQCQELYMGYPM